MTRSGKYVLLYMIFLVVEKRNAEIEGSNSKIWGKKMQKRLGRRKDARP